MDHRAKFIAAIISLSVSTNGAAEDCHKGALLRVEGSKLAVGSAEQESKFREGIKECPSLAELHYDLGVNLLSQNKTNEAIESFKSAVKLEPDPTFLYAVATGLTKKGDNSAAAEEYRKMHERYPKDTRPLVGLASISSTDMDYAKSEEYLRQAIQLDPKDGRLFFNLGAVLESQKKYDEALTSYEAALDKLPDDVQVIARVGELRLRLGRADSAEQLLHRAVLSNATDGRTWALLANVYTAKGRKRDALEAIEKAVQYAPKDPNVIRVRGVLLAENGDDEEGLKMLASGVENFPRDSELRVAYGYVLLKVRKLDEAQREFETALSIDPNNISGHHNLGVLLEERGQSEQAAKHFEMSQPRGVIGSSR